MDMSSKIFLIIGVVLIIGALAVGAFWLTSCAPETPSQTLPFEWEGNAVPVKILYVQSHTDYVYNVIRFVDTEYDNVCYINYTNDDISCVPMKGE